MFNFILHPIARCKLICDCNKANFAADRFWPISDGRLTSQVVCFAHLTRLLRQQPQTQLSLAVSQHIE